MAIIYLSKDVKKSKYESISPKEVLKSPTTTAVGTCSSDGRLRKRLLTILFQPEEQLRTSVLYQCLW